MKRYFLTQALAISLCNELNRQATAGVRFVALYDVLNDGYTINVSNGSDCAEVFFEQLKMLAA